MITDKQVEAACAAAGEMGFSAVEMSDNEIRRILEAAEAARECVAVGEVIPVKGGDRTTKKTIRAYADKVHSLPIGTKLYVGATPEPRQGAPVSYIQHSNRLAAEHAQEQLLTRSEWEALAAAAPRHGGEPVAWMVKFSDDIRWRVSTRESEALSLSNSHTPPLRIEPLYAAPVVTDGRVSIDETVDGQVGGDSGLSQLERDTLECTNILGEALIGPAAMCIGHLPSMCRDLVEELQKLRAPPHHGGEPVCVGWRARFPSVGHSRFNEGAPTTEDEKRCADNGYQLIRLYEFAAPVSAPAPSSAEQADQPAHPLAWAYGTLGEFPPAASSAPADERSRFEAAMQGEFRKRWILSRHPFVRIPDDAAGTNAGTYAYVGTQMAWAAWQARAQASEPVSAQAAVHSDDVAVDRFALLMKQKMAAAREKGRGGWDDPEQCHPYELAELLFGHLGKGNDGNYIDIANFCMMLALRSAPASLIGDELKRYVKWCIDSQPLSAPADAREGGDDAEVIKALRIDLKECQSFADRNLRDARRYRIVRRGQHWSVINGAGETLRAEALDAAADVIVDRAFGASATPAVSPDDSARIDWLQEQLVDTIYLDDGATLNVNGNSVRAAIDRAMGAGGGK